VSNLSTSVKAHGGVFFLNLWGALGGWRASGLRSPGRAPQRGLIRSFSSHKKHRPGGSVPNLHPTAYYPPPANFAFNSPPPKVSLCVGESSLANCIAQQCGQHLGFPRRVAHVLRTPSPPGQESDHLPIIIWPERPQRRRPRRAFRIQHDAGRRDGSVWLRPERRGSTGFRPLEPISQSQVLIQDHLTSASPSHAIASRRTKIKDCINRPQCYINS
jgi:hypothetical protein